MSHTALRSHLPQLCASCQISSHDATLLAPKRLARLPACQCFQSSQILRVTASQMHCSDALQAACLSWQQVQQPPACKVCRLQAGRQDASSGVHRTVLAARTQSWPGG